YVPHAEYSVLEIVVDSRSDRLDADNYETNPELKKICEERGYSYMICYANAHFLQDVCEVCPEKLPNYEEKIKSFFEEHLHTNEEIRYYVVGSGYFDVRNCNDGWIRIWVKKGGLIILPAGIYLITKLFVSLREKVATTPSAPPATTPQPT
ncbi:hypothetical protein HN873_071367, partial [Arachis hypogaea]